MQNNVLSLVDFFLRSVILLAVQKEKESKQAHISIAPLSSIETIFYLLHCGSYLPDHDS